MSTGIAKSSLTRSILGLYATILRLHRSLPADMRSLGDTYVKDEFRRHRTAPPEYIQGFEAMWANYRDALRTQISSQGLEHP